MVVAAALNKPEISISDKIKPLRNTTIDVLRGVAVVLVLIHHFILIDKSLFTNPFSKIARYSLTFWVRGGWIGVDLFFMLSGFLISGLLFSEYKRTERIVPSVFLIRRGFKLYPSFIFFIFSALAIERFLAIYNNSFYYPFLDYLRDLLFIENYFFGRFAHTWSLDVEEFFYLTLPFYLILTIKYSKISFKIFLRSYLALASICFIFRIIQHFYYGDHTGYYFKTQCRLDSLFFGVFISYIYAFEKDRFNFIYRNSRIYIVLSIIFILPNFIFVRAENPLQFVFLCTNAVCFGVIMIALLELNPKFLKSRLFSFIGKNSYNIYLWHVLLNSILLNLLFEKKDKNEFIITSFPLWIAYALSYFLGSILIGTIFTKIIEEPLLKYRNVLFPSKSIISILKNK